jgi:hypothetical protein
MLLTLGAAAKGKAIFLEIYWSHKCTNYENEIVVTYKYFFGKLFLKKQLNYETFTQSMCHSDNLLFEGGYEEKS